MVEGHCRQGWQVAPWRWIPETAACEALSAVRAQCRQPWAGGGCRVWLSSSNGETVSSVQLKIPGFCQIQGLEGEQELPSGTHGFDSDWGQIQTPHWKWDYPVHGRTSAPGQKVQISFKIHVIQRNQVSDLTVKRYSEKAESPEEGGANNIDPDVVKIDWGHLFQVSWSNEQYDMPNAQIYFQMIKWKISQRIWLECENIHIGESHFQ